MQVYGDGRTLRFVLLYGVPAQARLRASEDITAAMAAGDLTVLPVRRFPLDDIAVAHEAVEAGTVGKVLVDVP
jgi:NADPH:quinone reductase